MDAKLLKLTTDAELEKYHSREEVLVARGMKKIVDWTAREYGIEWEEEQLQDWGITDATT